MFKDMGIAKRLILGFGVVTAILVTVLIFALQRFADSNQLITKVIEQDVVKLELASDSAIRMSIAARQVYSLFVVEDFDSMLREIEANVEVIDANIALIAPMLYHDRGKKILSNILQAREAYIQSYSNILQMLRQGDRAEARIYMQDQVVPHLELLLKEVGLLVSLQTELMDGSGQETLANYQSSRLLILMSLAGALALATVLAMWVVRSVLDPLGGEPRQVQRVTERISEGDLTEQLLVKKNDVKSLMASMARMQANLRQIIQGLAGNADAVSSSSVQLSAASRQITESSAIQTEAGNSMAVAMEQMSANISQVAASANETLIISEENGKLASDGEKIFEATVKHMHNIAEVVNRTAKQLHEAEAQVLGINTIIELIHSISEQTNLLALNAAIEAARAGTHGRGFAVVADEVRQLAERTSKATTEISSLIDQVVESTQAAEVNIREVVRLVEEGVVQVEQSGASTQQINISTQQVLQAMNEISSALHEQQLASTEISERIEQISAMSEENYQAISEVTGTAGQLESLAGETLEAVQKFRLS